MNEPTQFTTEQAIALAKTEWWKTSEPKDIVALQLYQDKLCMPFANFHLAVEKVLDRPVFTHEFAHHELLKQEFEGKAPPPSFEEIIDRLKQLNPNVIVALCPENQP